LEVSSSLEETCASKLVGPPGNDCDVDGAAKNAQIRLADEAVNNIDHPFRMHPQLSVSHQIRIPHKPLIWCTLEYKKVFAVTTINFNIICWSHVALKSVCYVIAVTVVIFVLVH